MGWVLQFALQYQLSDNDNVQTFLQLIHLGMASHIHSKNPYLALNNFLFLSIIIKTYS